MSYRVLISGAGIAGPALAFWLRRHGFTPTLIERAPRFRDSGYMIDVWGLGYDLFASSFKTQDRARALVPQPRPEPHADRAAGAWYARRAFANAFELPSYD